MSLVRLLAHNKRLWVPPIVIFLALLAWLAWRAANAPDEAFDYRMD